MKLTDKAMLARPRITLWSAKKHDAKVSAEVAQSHGTSTEAGRYNKHLLAGFDAPLKAVQKLANEARTFHYENTLAWADDGARILPAANFFDYSQRMGEFRERFETTVGNFCTEYPNLRENARRALNGLFNPDDYPDERDIARRFDFDVAILPMPDAQDFRVNLGDAEVAAIRQEIEKRTEEATAGAMRDLWQRLYDCVTAMRDKLAVPDAIFRDSLVGNLRDLCALLPKLNVTGDEKLQALADQAEHNLAAHNPETLRESPAARATAAQDAARIAKLMESYMGAPQ